VWGVAFGVVGLLFAVAVALQVLVMLTERSVYRDDPTGWIYFLITATVYAFGATGCFMTARQLFKRRAATTPNWSTEPS